MPPTYCLPGSLPTLPTELNLDIEARNPYPLAFYLEPEGCLELSRIKGPKQGKGGNADDYLRLIPETWALADTMYNAIPNRWYWAWQKRDGQWCGERFGNKIEFKSCNGCRYAEHMDRVHVLKALSGRTHAFGTSDYPFRGDTFGLPWNMVNCLRYDVDENYKVDGHWWRLDDLDVSRGAVWRVISRQAEMMTALGLGFRAYRTGARGIQLVIPLPSPTPHAVASVIAYGIKRALTPAGGDDYQCNVLNDAVLRMPGGLHSTGHQGLGLWIDIDGQRLFPINRQAELMVNGFEFDPKRCSRVWTSYDQDVAHIWELLGMPPQMMDKLEPTITDEEKAIKLIDTELNIELFDRIRGMSEAKTTPTNASVSIPTSIAETHRTPRPDRGAYTLEWATQTWRRAYGPGGFKRWFHDERGLIAAVMLFGWDTAEQELIKQARSIPPGNPSSVVDRTARIRSSVAHFREKYRGRTPPKETVLRVVGPSDPEIDVLAKRIVEQIPRGRQAKWSQSLAMAVSTLILTKLRDGQYEYAEMSKRTAGKEIERRWPKLPHTALAVSNMFKLLETSGAFVRQTRRHTRGEADAWGCGRLAAGAFANRMTEKAPFPVMNMEGSDSEIVL